MNRRNLLKSLGALATLAALPIAACSFSVTGMLSTVISALSAILSYAGAGQSWLPQVQQVLAQLQTELAAWQAGTGTMATLEQILNDALPILALIPLTAAYAPLIALVVSAIESIINYFGSASAKIKLAQMQNPYFGRIALNKPHFAQTYQGAFKEQFTSTAIGIGLPQCKIA